MYYIKKEASDFLFKNLKIFHSFERNYNVIQCGFCGENFENISPFHEEGIKTLCRHMHRCADRKLLDALLKIKHKDKNAPVSPEEETINKLKESIEHAQEILSIWREN